MELFEVHSLPTLFVGCYLILGSRQLAAMSLKAAQAKLKRVADQVITAKPGCCRFSGAAQKAAFDANPMQCQSAAGSCEIVQAVQYAKTHCGRSVAHLKAQINSCLHKSAYSKGSAPAESRNLGVNAVRNASGGEASQC